MRHFLAHALVITAAVASLRAAEIAEVDLAPRATRASDGFHFELTAGPVDGETRRGVPYRQIWCTFQVPERVQQTQFVQAALEVFDGRGRPLAFASVSSWDGGHRMRVLAVGLDARFAGRCRLLVRYGEPPHGALVTEYRIPLKEHVRAPQ